MGASRKREGETEGWEVGEGREEKEVAEGNDEEKAGGEVRDEGARTGWFQRSQTIARFQG